MGLCHHLLGDWESQHDDGVLFVILFGLGIDFGIHMFARYLEDRIAHSDVRSSIDTMLIQTGQAVFTAALTTSMAFFSLTITDFKGFSEFGFIVGTGILMSLVAMTTVLPAFIVLADEKLGLIRARPVWGHRNLQTTRGRFPRAKTVLAIGVIVTAYFAYNLRHIQFEYDFTNLRSNLPASAEVKRKIGTISPFNKLSQSPSLVLARDKKQLDEIVSAVEVKIAEEDPTPTIDTVRTLWSFLPKDQEDKMDLIEEIRELTSGPSADLIKGGTERTSGRTSGPPGRSAPGCGRSSEDDSAEVFGDRREPRTFRVHLSRRSVARWQERDVFRGRRPGN